MSPARAAGFVLAALAGGCFYAPDLSAAPGGWSSEGLLGASRAEILERCGWPRALRADGRAFWYAEVTSGGQLVMFPAALTLAPRWQHLLVVFDADGTAVAVERATIPGDGNANRLASPPDQAAWLAKLQAR